MEQYSFIVKNNSQKAFNTFFWFLYFLHVIAAAVIALKAADPFHQLYATGTLLFFVAASAFFYFLKKRVDHTAYKPLMLVAMILLWPFESAWLPAIIFTTLIVFAWLIKDRKATISFSADGILLKNVLTKKQYQWPEVEYTVLKDGLLTVNFLNNHFLQADTQGQAIDEEVFNTFCHRQIVHRS